MAELTLRLEVHPETKKQTLVVSLVSDRDALPSEHEEEHKALVKRLVEAGLLAEGVGLRVEREGAATLTEGLGETTAERQAKANAG